jgi:hypothetical protein
MPYYLTIEESSDVLVNTENILLKSFPLLLTITKNNFRSQRLVSTIQNLIGTLKTIALVSLKI